jgi:hypothetical protein
MMDITVEVQNVSFIIDAEDGTEAIARVEDILQEYAWDWTQPYVG